MKWFYRFSFCAILFFAVSARAQNIPLAAGVRISSNAPVINNSISGRYYIKPNQAFEGLLSFKPFAIGGLYEIFTPLQVEGLNWFYGGGAFVGFSKPISAGVHGIIGLDYNFTNLPVNLSLDWKPELILTHTVNFEPAAVGISARFIFSKVSSPQQ